MKPRALFFAAVAALSAIVVVTIIYIAAFGTKQSSDSAIWGQFGDYFGGILNPLFALAAFLSALWTIGVQQREGRTAASQLAEQTNLARRELEALNSDRLGEEFVHVIREIDSRLSELLQTIISPPGVLQTVTIMQMVAEAERIAITGGTSASLDGFISQANLPGAVVEAYIREIKYLVDKLRQFLDHYSRLKSTSYAPVLVYYADKTYRILHMLEAVGGIPEDTRRFFATVGDANG